MSPPRDYNSPARDAVKAETRARILEAVVEVVRTDGVHAFSVQNVARKAGVSHRTVYRHFATREDLLDGLAESIDALTQGRGLPSQPDDLGKLPDTVRGFFERFDEARDLMQVYVITSIALGRVTPSHQHRTRTLEAAMARAFPRLPADELHRAAALLRTLTSSRTWFGLTVEHELSSAEAGQAAAWALQILIDDLARRDRLAPLPPPEPR
ncbi:MAG: TetR/AcrR family transcriptional regulator [Alphaproteobacteria bacterium]|nr:TetR/AcrR family transcriptional regulator [Alphaproteobacteria bacterium]